MGILIAALHIAGAVAALLGIWFLMVLTIAWEKKRNLERTMEAIAAKLGVSVDELQRGGLDSRIMQILTDRFDDELLRNRLSDLCGWIRSGWEWLVTFGQLALLLGVAWTTFTGDLGNAVYAWLVVPLTIFSFVVTTTFSLMCKLLTGRTPGEARAGRKSIHAELARTTAEG